MTIQPIVEGYGEVYAIPIILRRFLNDAGMHDISVGKPVRRHRSKLVQESEIRRAVRLALLQSDCGGILIIFDSDDDCPRELAPQIEAWAKREAGAVPCAVVMAHHEYEAWFLASLAALRGVRGILPNAKPHVAPESPRDAKGELRRCMVPGRGYAEVIDQPALTARMNFGAAYSQCRSFRKLTKAFADLVAGMGNVLVEWPPKVWET